MKLHSRLDVLFGIALTMVSVMLHNLHTTLAISAVVSLSTLTRWDHYVRGHGHHTGPHFVERVLVIVELWAAGAACAFPMELAYNLVEVDAPELAVFFSLVAGAIFYVTGKFLSRQVNQLWSANPAR